MFRIIRHFPYSKRDVQIFELWQEYTRTNPSFIAEYDYLADIHTITWYYNVIQPMLISHARNFVENTDYLTLALIADTFDRKKIKSIRK